MDTSWYLLTVNMFEAKYCHFKTILFTDSLEEIPKHACGWEQEILCLFCLSLSLFVILEINLRISHVLGEYSVT